MDATGFSSLSGKGFNPTMTSQVRATYLKRCVAGSQIRWCLHFTGSQSERPIRSDVMADQKFGANTLALTVLKRVLSFNCIP